MDSCGLARLPNSLVFLTSLEMTPVCPGSLTVYESEGHRFDSRGLEPDIVLGKIPQPRRTDFGFWSKRSDSVSDASPAGFRAERLRWIKPRLLLQGATVRRPGEAGPGRQGPNYPVKMESEPSPLGPGSSASGGTWARATGRPGK